MAVARSVGRRPSKTQDQEESCIALSKLSAVPPGPLDRLHTRYPALYPPQQPGPGLQCGRGAGRAGGPQKVPQPRERMSRLASLSGYIAMTGGLGGFRWRGNVFPLLGGNRLKPYDAKGTRCSSFSVRTFELLRRDHVLALLPCVTMHSRSRLELQYEDSLPVCPAIYGQRASRAHAQNKEVRTQKVSFKYPNCRRRRPPKFAARRGRRLMRYLYLLMRRTSRTGRWNRLRL